MSSTVTQTEERTRTETISLISNRQRAKNAIAEWTRMERFMEIIEAHGESYDVLSERLNREGTQIVQIHLSARSLVEDFIESRGRHLAGFTWTVEELENLFSLMPSELLSRLDEIQVETTYKVDLMRKTVLVDPFYKKPLQKPVKESETSFWVWEAEELVQYINCYLTVVPPTEAEAGMPPEERATLSPYTEQPIHLLEGTFRDHSLVEGTFHPHEYGQAMLEWFKTFRAPVDDQPRGDTASVSNLERGLVESAVPIDRSTLGIRLFMYKMMAANVQKIRNERVRAWHSENLQKMIEDLKIELKETTEALEAEFEKKLRAEAQGLTEKLANIELQGERRAGAISDRLEAATTRLVAAHVSINMLQTNCTDMEEVNRRVRAENAAQRQEIQRLHHEASQRGKGGGCVIL